jgi:hypothetical protein
MTEGLNVNGRWCYEFVAWISRKNAPRIILSRKFAHVGMLHNWEASFICPLKHLLKGGIVKESKRKVEVVKLSQLQAAEAFLDIIAS